jgi:hypothetical protein
VTGGRDPRLGAAEQRLRSILAAYEDRLETASIYSIPTLRRPGAKAHDWFAFVKPASRHVSLFLLPVQDRPALLASSSDALRRRHTGKATFTFASLDDELAAEVEALVARAFDAYMGGQTGSETSSSSGIPAAT